MNDIANKKLRIFSLVISVFLGSIAAFIFYLIISDGILISKKYFFISICIFIFSSLIFHYINSRFLFPSIRKNKTAVPKLLLSLISVILIYISIPINKAYFFLPNTDLIFSISPFNLEKNTNCIVEIEGIYLNYRWISLDELTAQNDGRRIEDKFLINSCETSEVRWIGKFYQKVRLVMSIKPAGGAIEIDSNINSLYKEVQISNDDVNKIEIVLPESTYNIFLVEEVPKIFLSLFITYLINLLLIILKELPHLAFPLEKIRTQINKKVLPHLAISLEKIRTRINKKVLPHRAFSLEKIRTHRSANTILSVLICFLILFLLINPLNFIYNYSTYSYPLEYRDAASISTAIAFSNSKNPYIVANFPENIYLYGFLYPALISPFIKGVEHPILAARWINLSFLILILILSFYIIRKNNTSKILSIIGAFILLNSSFLIEKINGTRPDLPGLFLSLLAILVIILQKPNLPTLIFSALLCIASFYFKQYMVFSIPIIGIYLFLFISKQKGLLFVSLTILIAIASLLIVRFFFPLYIEYSILHHINNTYLYLITLVSQNKFFFQNYWILFLFIGIWIIKIFFVSDFSKIELPGMNLTSMQEPLIKGFKIGIFDIGIMISSMLIVFSLGRHGGNFYTYYGELLLPFIIYSFIPKIDDLTNNHFNKKLIGLAILLFCVFPSQKHYSTDFASYTKSFQEVYRNASNCTNIYDGTPLMGIYMLENNLYPIYNNGQTKYALTIISKKGSFLSEFLYTPPDLLLNQYNYWNEKIESNIKNQNFDCIIFDSHQNLPNLANYRQIKSIDNVLGSTVFIFTPIE